MNVPIWPGSSSFASGSGDTPFGFYDAQTDFQTDSDKVAVFCANRMGYPLVDVELQSGSFYTAFEEAVTTYGNELYAYKVRDNQLTLEGLPTSSVLTQSLITPSFEPIVRLTEMYGAEAGSGGNVPWYSGSFTLEAGRQDYDFNTFMTDNDITGSAAEFGIEVKRVFYQPPYPASALFLSPYNGFGFGGAIAAGIAGVGGFGGDFGFLMMPLNYDMQVIQAIGMNQMVRRSNYSFEIHNDKLRIFPIPTANGDKNYTGQLRKSRSLTISGSVPTTTVNQTSGSFALTGISGSGATGEITSAGLKITKVTVVATGSDYVKDDIITVTSQSLSSAGFGTVSNDLTIKISNSDIQYTCGAGSVWFEYIIRSERIEGSVQNLPTRVTNVSNTPYANPNYNYINSIGRQWIFEYTLALSKEMLGYVRGKYASIPIPNAEVNLNQGDLISAATAEKTALLERLRNFFDETSRQALLNRRASEAEAKMTELQQVPYTIFIG
jgi:hypothetical protein